MVVLAFIMLSCVFIYSLKFISCQNSIIFMKQTQEYSHQHKILKNQLRFVETTLGLWYITNELWLSVRVAKGLRLRLWKCIKYLGSNDFMVIHRRLIVW